MSTWTKEEASKAVKLVVDKATTDKVFREKLLTSPSEAISELTGKPVSSKLALKVIETNPDTEVLLQIPPFRKDGSLPDSQLDGVSGGMTDKQSCGMCLFVGEGVYDAW